METCVYAAAGCNEAAYNIFDGLEPLAPYKPLMASLTKIRGFIEKIVSAQGRSRPLGIYNGWTPRRNAARALEEGDWLDSSVWTDANPNDVWAAETVKNPKAGEPCHSHDWQLCYAGLPPAYRLSEAQATVLSGETAWSLNDDETVADSFARPLLRCEDIEHFA